MYGNKALVAFRTLSELWIFCDECWINLVKRSTSIYLCGEWKNNNFVIQSWILYSSLGTFINNLCLMDSFLIMKYIFISSFELDTIKNRTNLLT